MPSWKKVITSGSSAALNSLTVSNGITGSLFGTASYATQALSASYAPSAGLTGGTANYIPIWNTATSLSSSAIYQSASNVGIGTTTPNYKLHITGSGTSGSFNANGTLIVSGSNVGIGTTTPNAKLDVSGSAIISGSFTVTPGTIREFQVNTTGVDIGNLITDTHTVTGSLSVSGSVSILSSILQYSNNTAITSGSTANIASFSTSSFTAGFFDYVATSGTNARAGSVFTVWNGNNVEYAETSTNDIGSTTNLILSASVAAGAIRLQGTSLSGSWSVKTLARMI